uniref:Uncharacterized protein n=1 Tax=Siphoviridae sp. ctDmQ3 TaxID=2823570 RepID=A0A8S5L826_9CAUD|nr:MAG TPA: hypothetical protein [Siphoviridae sp. ctDmQ3]
MDRLIQTRFVSENQKSVVFRQLLVYNGYYNTNDWWGLYDKLRLYIIFR